MSELFILTQETTLVNVEKIQRIAVVGGVAEDVDTHEEIDAIEIAAVMDDSENTEIMLGLYFSETRATEAMTELVNWLGEKNEYNRVFTMPTFDDDEEDTEKYKYDEIGLDYGFQEKEKSSD